MNVRGRRPGFLRRLFTRKRGRRNIRQDDSGGSGGDGGGNIDSNALSNPSPIMDSLPSRSPSPSGALPLPPLLQQQQEHAVEEPVRQRGRHSVRSRIYNALRLPWQPSITRVRRRGSGRRNTGMPVRALEVSIDIMSAPGTGSRREQQQQLLPTTRTSSTSPEEVVGSDHLEFLRNAMMGVGEMSSSSYPATTIGYLPPHHPHRRPHRHARSSSSSSSSSSLSSIVNTLGSVGSMPSEAISGTLLINASDGLGLTPEPVWRFRPRAQGAGPDSYARNLSDLLNRGSLSVVAHPRNHPSVLSGAVQADSIRSGGGGAFPGPRQGESAIGQQQSASTSSTGGRHTIVDAFRRLRNDILSEVAAFFTDQREVEAANLELEGLRRRQEMRELSRLLAVLEAEYDGLRGSSNADTVPLELTTRLVLSRLLLDVSTVGSELITARQHAATHGSGGGRTHSAAAAATMEAGATEADSGGENMVERTAEHLGQLLQTLARVSVEGADISDQVAIESVLSQQRTTNITASTSAAVTVVTAGESQAGRHYSTTAASTTTTSVNGSTLSDSVGDGGVAAAAVEEEEDLMAQIACQKLRIKLLKSRSSGNVELMVRRSHLVSDSSDLLWRLPSDHLRRRLRVRFEGEEATDYGGVARDWLASFSSALTANALAKGLLHSRSYDGDFDYNSSLLDVASDVSARASVAEQQHVFESLGRLAGLSAFHGYLVDMPFSPAFYRSVLRSTACFKDAERESPELAAGLRYLLDNTGASELGLTWTVDDTTPVPKETAATAPTTTTKTSPIVVTTHELVPGGAELSVTDENKADYVERLVAWRLDSVYRQDSAAAYCAAAFRRGMLGLLDPEDLDQLRAPELSLFLNGVADIDVEAWRANTRYENGYSDNSPAVQHFWQAVTEMAPRQRYALIKFATGSSRLVPGNFRTTPFCLYRQGSPNHLPVAHTCVNRIDLPDYADKGTLKDRFALALAETEGFGIV